MQILWIKHVLRGEAICGWFVRSSGTTNLQRSNPWFVTLVSHKRQKIPSMRGSVPADSETPIVTSSILSPRGAYRGWVRVRSYKSMYVRIYERLCLYRVSQKGPLELTVSLCRISMEYWNARPLESVAELQKWRLGCMVVPHLPKNLF
jgi:hypothetical protein